MSNAISLRLTSKIFNSQLSGLSNYYYKNQIKQHIGLIQ
jgi:hypothetical protein